MPKQNDLDYSELETNKIKTNNQIRIHYKNYISVNNGE